jgi:predicted transcriptional regulator
MTLKDVKNLLEAKLVCGENLLDSDIELAFASDLMSDVLTMKHQNFLLITGLCNIQTIRTAEMADLNYLLLCRDKHASEEMIELAIENEMIILETGFSMFTCVGVLYANGMRGIY